MITLEHNSYNGYIEIFGRNPEGKLYSKKDYSFKPYFYIENKNGEFNTLDDKKASKIIVSNQKEIKEKLKYLKDKNHYESDLISINRYIIDKIVKIEREPIRICYLDIEILEGEGYSDVNEAKNIINLIGVKDSFTNKYTCFSLKDFEKSGGEVFMLSAFIQYIQTTDPDIILSWNGNNFDFPYILNRMKGFEIDLNRLGRSNGFSYVNLEYFNSCKIYGRILFDLMEAYKKHFASGGRESWSLDYISKYELGDLGGKEEYEGKLDDLYYNNHDKFIEYNKRDIELLVLLNEKLNIINFFDEIRRLAFCRFEDVFMNSKTADCLCLKWAKKRNIVLPSINKKPQDKYEGGYVMQCNPKLYENIVVMDFKSLYPSIMIGFNTSYETISDTGEINVDNKYRFIREQGIIPSIVEPLLEKREKIKEELKKLDSKSLEYKNLKLMEKAYKVVANSFYGVLGFSSFRLYKREVAAAITYIARRVIKEAIDWFEKKGYKIIYTDTDSVFIQFDKIDIDFIKRLNEEVNEYFNMWVKQFGITKRGIFDLEFENVFSVLFFKQKDSGEGAKKKYAGKIIWKNGMQTKEVAIVGFESRRSDNSQIGRDFLKNVLEMILEKDSPEKVRKYVEDFKENIKSGKFKPEEIAFPVGINKNLKDYENVIHIRASRLANKRHNEGIKKGDKIKWIYIKDDEDNVIAFKKKLPKEYKIDYDEMIRRIVDLKIEPIFRSLNWSYTEKHKSNQIQQTLL